MKKQHSRYHISKKKWVTIMAWSAVVGALLLVLLLTVLFFRGIGEKGEALEDKSAATNMQNEEENHRSTLDATGNAKEEDSTAKETEPTNETQILPHLAEMYEQNPDLAGWIKIEDTVVDYPVMYTPEDGEKYIYADFQGKFNVAGLPFIEDDCCMDPESDNLIIYGHNMKNGSMFASLMKYQKETYWKEHPTILFSTLHEEREYEIVSAFYDKVYYQHENCFKFYQFIDARDEARFNEAMDYYYEHALYDTGVTAEYGDRLITLVTCAYHIENGRFVVVAREKEASPLKYDGLLLLNY